MKSILAALLCACALSLFAWVANANATKMRGGGTPEQIQATIRRNQEIRSRILARLNAATNVTLVEHSNRFDENPPTELPFREKVYRRLVLSADQVQTLKSALLPIERHEGALALGCIFEPHHRIEIRASEEVFIVELCFRCGTLEVGGEYGIMPDGWYGSLWRFFESLKMDPQKFSKDTKKG